MRVRMLTSVSGLDPKTGPYLHEEGEEYELPAAEAKAYCSLPKDFPRAEPVAVKRREKAETR